MVLDAEQDLFLHKVKFILLEVEHFLTVTLDKEHLSRTVTAVKTNLVKQIVDFKKQNPSLQTAWEQVEFNADGTVRIKPLQATTQPTARQAVKPSIRVPASPKLPAISSDDLKDSAVLKKDKKAAKKLDKQAKQKKVQQPVEEPTQEIEEEIYELEPEDSPVMPPPEDPDPNKGFSDTDSEDPYADINDLKPSDFSNVAVQGFLMKKRRKGLGAILGPQKRWCALKDNMLFYFPKQTDGCQGKAIKLESYTFRTNYETSAKSIYPFVLVGPGKPSFEFIADSEAERLKWTNAINKLRKDTEKRRDPPAPCDEIYENGDGGDAPPENQNPREVSLYDDIDTLRQKIDGMMPKKSEDACDEDVDLGLRRRSDLPSDRNQGHVDMLYTNDDSRDNMPPGEIYDEGETARPPIFDEEENLYEETGDPASRAPATGLYPIADRREKETGGDVTTAQLDDADPGPPVSPPPPIPKSRRRPEAIPPIPNPSAFQTEEPSEHKAQPPATQPKPYRGKRSVVQSPEMAEALRQRRAHVGDSDYGEVG